MHINDDDNASDDDVDDDNVHDNFFRRVDFSYIIFPRLPIPLIVHYQTLHLLAGFIGVFAGQLKAVENSFRFDKVPMTLFLILF